MKIQYSHRNQDCKRLPKERDADFELQEPAYSAAGFVEQTRQASAHITLGVTGHTMRVFVADLIKRMCAREQVADSDQSVSWNAHREAERMSAPDLVDELKSFVTSSTSKDERKAAYFILGALGANTEDPRCARVLVERLRLEKDKYVLAVALDALAKIEKPGGFPLDSMIECLSDDRWLVRHAAIRGLRKTNSAAVEERLLQHLSSTSEPEDIIYCHATLGSIGSAKALPALRAALDSRKRDVKASAEAAVGAITSRLGTLRSSEQ